MEALIPIFLDRLVQGCVGHRGALKEHQKPVGSGHDHVVVIAIVVGGHVDLLNPRDFISPMLLKESHNATVRELLDPVSRLPHPILNGDGKARAMSITVEHIPFRAFFSGKCGTVVDKMCAEELEFLSLSIALPGPLFAVLPMLIFTLLKSTDEAVGNVGDSVEVISNLDGRCGCAW
jgi:hypothetical protein